jgi:hypothetical protein
MRPVIRLACGLSAATLLLLAGASAAFAADPLVTIDGSGGTTSDVTAVADAGTSSGSAALGADAPTTTADGADGSATVSLGADAPTTTADGADGSATVSLGADAPDSVGEPSSSVGALSSGFASVMAFGDTTAEDTTGVALGAPAMDGDFLGSSQTFGSLLASAGSGGAPSPPDESGGSGDAAGESGAGTLPETSTEVLATGPGAGFPIRALLLGLLAGGLLARRRSVRSAS